MGNGHSTPLQKCLSDVFAADVARVAFPSYPLYQVQYVKPYNLDIPVVPAAVTRPQDADEISSIIQCALESNVKVQPRSGGHSYGNYGLGGEDGAVVIDMASFQRFSMDKSTWQAKVGSGMLLGDLTTELHDNGKRAIAHGTCPQVGMGGHATIGGLGPASRMWGAALDHVDEVEVVLANATITRASDTQNPDLFFALKGAGASFGIITEFTLHTHPEPKQPVQYSYSFTLDGFDDMASIFEAWQELVSDPNLSRKFASQVIVSEIGMIISGTFFGSKTEHDKLGLESKLPRAPALKSVVVTDWLGAVAQWANDVIQKGGGGIAAPFYAKSLAFRNDTLMSNKTIKNLFEMFDKAEKGTLGWFAIFDLAGGAINDIGQGATAYAHRDALFYLQSYAIGIPSVSDKTTKFLDDINTLIEKSMPGADLGAYAGYVDPAMPDGEAQERYWGSNYPQLQAIKKKYDPKDVFHNPQSVRPA